MLDFTLKMTPVALSAHAPMLESCDETGAAELTGRVMTLAPVDPAYGADAGTRLAFVCDESSQAPGALIAVALSETQMPQLAVGDRVRTWGCPEPLTAPMEDGMIELGVLAALDIQPA